MRSFIWIAALGLTCLFAIAPSASAQQPDRDWADCAQNQDRERAIRGCTAILNRRSRETTQNRSIAFNNRGLAHALRGDFTAAIADHSESLRLNPSEFGFIHRGLAYADQNNLDAAIADFSDAIRINPRNDNSFTARGLAHVRKGNFDAAITDYNDALRLNPSSGEAFYGRGFARARAGQLDAGIADFDQAIRLNPRHDDALYRRGNAHADKGNFRAALADYDEAIRLNPRRAIAFNDRGNAHATLGNRDAAIADFNEAIRLSPGLAVAFNNRGIEFRTRGNLNQAFADYNEAIRLNPREAGFFVNRGAAEASRGNRSAAIADYTTALSLDPRSPIALFERGRLHSTDGNANAAISDFDEASRLAPLDSRYVIFAAFSRRDAGRLRDALAVANEAAGRLPNSPGIQSSRATFLLDLGEMNEAVRAAEAAINGAEQGPASAGHLVRAISRMWSGDHPGAEADLAASLERARDLSPVSRASVQLNRGEASIMAGRADDAAPHFRAALDALASVQADVSSGVGARIIAARAHWRLGNLPAAHAEFEHVARTAYRTSGFLSGLAEARLSVGDVTGAASALAEAQALAPGDVRRTIAVASLLRARGDEAAANRMLQEAAALGNAEARALLGVPATVSVQAAQPAPQQLPSPSQALAAPTERRVALVIGNGNYRAPGLTPLANPARDARAMAALFREIGFQHVAIHIDLDQAGMLRALRDFEREAEQADWAAVYFAGHGIEINGANHLVPVDAQLRSDRDVPDEAVPLERVLARLEGARRLRMVILDACRDNPFLARMQRVATRSISRGLAPINDSHLPAGTLVAFAARAGQVAEDGTGENSPFVQALSRRMREPNVEISLLLRRVRDDVIAATNRRQEPFTYASLSGEELFVRRQ